MAPRVGMAVAALHSIGFAAPMREPFAMVHGAGSMTFERLVIARVVDRIDIHVVIGAFAAPMRNIADEALRNVINQDVPTW